MAEQVDYHVPSHAHSAGDICIISDMFDCFEIISLSEIFYLILKVVYFALKIFYFNTEPPCQMQEE